MGYRRFQIVCVFAEYDLFKKLEPYIKFYIDKFWYNFDTVLYQFLEAGTSDVTLLGLD